MYNIFRDKYSIDIKKIQEKKYNKIDKTLSENKNITLLKLKNETSDLKLLEEKKQHRKSLSSFETKTLLGEGPVIKELNNYSQLPRKIESNNNVNSIKIEKLNLKESIDNISIYKQRNLKREEMQKYLREKAKKKKVLKNKYQYIAQNAYNNTNTEGIMYERDMDLQRSFRFEKKEFKSVAKINKI